MVVLNEAGFKVHIPATFLKAVRYGKVTVDDGFYRFYLRNASPESVSDLRSRLDLSEDRFRPFEVNYGKEKYQPFREALYSSHKWGNAEPLADCLYEEWVFLQEQSMIVSRIRATAERFKEAGAIAVEFGRRATEAIVRKTVKKPDVRLSQIDYLRASFKWILVGGSALTPLFEIPPVALSAIGFSANVFQMYDP